MTRMQGLYYYLENRYWDLQRSRRPLYKALGILAAASIVLSLLFCFAIPGARYAYAKHRITQGDYAGAAYIFKDLGDFKDSRAYSDLYSLLAVEKGDIVKFGRFEQDGDPENGAEPIEWIAMKTEDSRVYLLSRSILHCTSYSREFGLTTWDISAPRAWLNDSFYETAFSETEKAAIALTHNEAATNPRYTSMPAGEATDDYVFLPSLDEVQAFFPADDDKFVAATPQAVLQGVNVAFTGYSWWWTRTVGCDRTLASIVQAQYYRVANVADFYGYNVNRSEGGIRPAIWVDTKLYEEALLRSLNG